MEAERVQIRLPMLRNEKDIMPVLICLLYLLKKIEMITGIISRLTFGRITKMVSSVKFRMLSEP